METISPGSTHSRLLGLTESVHIACVGELRVTPRVFFDLGQDGIDIVASPAPSIETRTNPVFTRDFRISLYITSRASLNSRRGVLFYKIPERQDDGLIVVLTNQSVDRRRHGIRS